MNRNVKYVIANRVANSEMSGWLHDAAVRIEENKVADVVPVANLPDDVDENAGFYGLAMYRSCPDSSMLTATCTAAPRPMHKLSH